MQAEKHVFAASWCHNRHAFIRSLTLAPKSDSCFVPCVTGNLIARLDVVRGAYAKSVEGILALLLDNTKVRPRRGGCNYQRARGY